MADIVKPSQLRQLVEQAAASPRKRSHLLLHAGHDDQVQRLLIVAEPGTYVRPHRHSEQWEMIAMQSGAMDLVTFDAQGVILAVRRLDRETPVAQIQMGEWHACVMREPGTIVLEVKPGPYRANEFADWSPPEGEPQAAGFLRWIEQARAGQSWPPAAVGR